MKTRLIVSRNLHCRLWVLKYTRRSDLLVYTLDHSGFPNVNVGNLKWLDFWKRDLVIQSRPYFHGNLPTYFYCPFFLNLARLLFFASLLGALALEGGYYKGSPFYCNCKGWLWRIIELESVLPTYVVEK